MVFAWQGFSLEHPEDWAPVTLSGTRSEGYARICSAGEAFLQLRWKVSSGEPSVSAVHTYLDRLGRDARKRKEPFERKIEESEGRIEYSYKGAGYGRGVLFPSNPKGAIYFLEAVAPTKGQLNLPLKRALSSFIRQSGEQERWSILGLDMRLPSPLKLEAHELRAGKTALTFSRRGSKIKIERWGFAEQLLQKHSLTNWTTAVAGLKHPDVMETEDGVELQQKRPLLPPVYVLAKVQTAQNQITVLRVESRRDSAKPQWNWFA